jgi:hypothetical protein
MGALALILFAGSGVVRAVEPGDPIRLSWVEGDVAGLTHILDGGSGKTIGLVEYRQHRSGDVIEAVRVAHFADGSSDEDRAEARVGKSLEAIRGRSIIRNRKGTPTVDISIDVATGHITGFSGLGKDRKEYDEKEKLTAGTYFGPLIAIVVRNFDENADGDKLVFRTVTVTPKPRVLDMELTREGTTSLAMPGLRPKVAKLTMRPTVNFLIDPIVQRLAPETNFFVQSGKPPAIVRFAGPRNYEKQKIRIE